VHRADNLPPLCDDCLQILRDSNSWIPKGLSRPVKGELSECLYLLYFAGNNQLYVAKHSIIIECSGTENLEVLQ